MSFLRLQHVTPQNGIRDIVTKEESFGNVSRGWPLPYQLKPVDVIRAKLTSNTWQCEISTDSFVKKHHVKFRAKANASSKIIDMKTLEQYGTKYGTVKLFKAMQCMNIDSPLGMAKTLRV